VLVNNDFIVNTMNVYFDTLSIENAAPTISGAETIVISITPGGTMT